MNAKQTADLAKAMKALNASVIAMQAALAPELEPKVTKAVKATVAKPKASPKAKTAKAGVRRLVANGKVTQVTASSLRKGWVFRMSETGAEYTVLEATTDGTTKLVRVDHPVLIAKGQDVRTFSKGRKVYRVTA